MTVAISPAIGQAYKSMYHDVDTRYNLCVPPPNLDLSFRTRVEQQARSVACFVDKEKLLKTSHNGSVQYTIQRPPVLTLASEVETQYSSHLIKALTFNLFHQALL